MLIRGISILTLLLHLTIGSEIKLVRTTVHHPKWKRDLAGFSYGSPLRRPHQKIRAVISALNPENGGLSFKIPVLKSTAAQNSTKVGGTKIYSKQILPLGLSFDPTNINIRLEEAPSINVKSPVFPSNRIPSESQLTGLYVNPNGRLPGDVRSRGYSHLHDSIQNKKTAFDSLNVSPIFQNFYGESLLPSVSQPIRNPIYKTRYEETRGTNSENIAHPTIQRSPYYTVASKVVAQPYIPLSPEYAALNKPRVLTAGTNAKLHTKPLYAFDFPSYEIPGIGNTNAFQAQPDEVSQEQYLSHLSPHELSQFSIFKDDRQKQKALHAGYQALADQPQLHFDHPNPWQTTDNDDMHILQQFGRIRTDVEVVDKKKPAPPSSTPSGDDDEGSNDDDEGHDNDEEYKFGTKDYSSDTNDGDDYSVKFAKEKDSKKSLPKSYGFQLYDEKFGRHSKKPRGNTKEKKLPAMLSDFSFNTEDGDSDEYLAKFYADYSPKHDYNEKNVKENKVKEKQEEDENTDYRETTQSNYESYEQELDKNYKPSTGKKSTSKSHSKSKYFKN